MIQRLPDYRFPLLIGLIAIGLLSTIPSAGRCADEPGSTTAKSGKSKKKSDEQIEAAAKAVAERKAAFEAEQAAKAAAKAEKDRLDAEAAAAKAALKVVTDRADAMLKRKLTRTADDVYRAVTQFSAAGDAGLSDEDRLVLYVQAGEWEKLRDLIATYPNDYPQRLYLRVLGELTSYGNRPIMLPSDVVRLADAAPVELDERHAANLGKLLTYAIAKGDARAELTALLQKGTKRLGGDDPLRRRMTARMLAAAEFWNEAKSFGLQDDDLPRDFAVAEPSPTAKLSDDVWAKSLADLRNPATVGAAREAALVALYQMLAEATPQTNDARLKALFADAAQRPLALEVVSLIGRQSASVGTGADFTLRTSTLQLQQAALKHFAVTASLDAEPQRTLANLYARNWLAEAHYTLQIFPSWLKSSVREKYQHVAVEDVVQAAPTGAWLTTLQPQLLSSVRLAYARLLLISDEIDRVVPVVGDFAARDPQTAAELANQYLVIWSQRHDPNISVEAMKQYKGLEGQAIVLTRAEQEQSLRQLGALLAKLDPATRKLLDEEQVVRAFDLCHSKAEIYTYDHVAAVFGPMAEMRPSLLLSLVERMRLKLTTNWRQLTVQRDAATRRTQDDVFQLVDDGYREAEKITSAWLSAHADDWRMSCSAGSLLSDWAEFAYFQAVAADGDADRFATYLQRTAEALRRFRESAAAYAAEVPKLKRAEFTLLPYRAWFYGLLGIAHDGDVNLRKGLTQNGLAEIREAMTSLPRGAAEVHLELFSTMVADNVKANRIAPEMKYRYLSSAVEITGRRATTYPAAEKVQYYDSLLSEVRLLTKLDGSDKIRTGGPFGVFVTLVHTADLARESGGFGKYLQNEVRRTVSGKTVTEQPFYRDRFEEALRLALGEFFEIRAILFADPMAGARDLTADEARSAGRSTDRLWQETPLAYLYLVAKDATVDRVPPLEIELDFFDRDGRVVIPVPSNPLLVEIADDAPGRRAVSDLSLTEIVDARELATNNLLKIDVIATAHGLVPDLDELLDLKRYALPVTQVDEREGLLVRELVAGPEGQYAASERSWTVHLDPTPLLRGAGKQIDFTFPQPKNADLQIAFKTYDDLDPVAAAATVTLVEGEAAAAIAKPNYTAWALGTVAGLAAVGLIWIVNARRHANGATAAPPRFTMPHNVTPFTVAALLQRIQADGAVKLADAERTELHRNVADLERAAFANDVKPIAVDDLQSLASRWIRTAS